MDRVRTWEELRGATPDIWKEAGAAGLLCIDTPTEYGGIGADYFFGVVAGEEQCYAGPDFYGPGFGLHSGIGKNSGSGFRSKHKRTPKSGWSPKWPLNPKLTVLNKKLDSKPSTFDGPFAFSTLKCRL